MKLDQYRDLDQGGYLYDGINYNDLESLIISGIFNFCGCGLPEEAIKFIRDVMAHIDRKRPDNQKFEDFYKEWSEEGDKIAPLGALYFTYYVLADKELTEHGGSVPGWLSPKGRETLELLNEYLTPAQT
jgi:hypothetical protein